MNFYHGTNYRNTTAIIAEGLKPGQDGSVHLTTDPKKAAMFADRRDADGVTVFVVDLPLEAVQPVNDGLMSGDDCFEHPGPVGPDLIDIWNAFRLTREGGKLVKVARIEDLIELFTELGEMTPPAAQ